MKHVLASCVVIALLLAGLPGCGPAGPAVGGTLVYGSIWEPSALNPIVAPDVVTKWILETIFDGLVAVNDKMEIVPELAETWDISPDGTLYTFKLRQGVKWHDGQALDADDVKFTYDTIVDPEQAGTIAKGDYALLDKVEVLDAHTVRFVLKSANAAFLSKLSVGIAPRHLLEGQAVADAPFNRQPVGSGPFKLEEWTAGQQVVLVANTAYWGGRPRLDKLVWKIMPDSNTLTVQILNGEVDGGLIVNPDDLPRFQGKAALSLYESIDANTYIGFNCERSPFNDQRVRQALNYGLDKQAIIDTLLAGQGIWSTGEILPTAWAYNPNVNTYPYEPTRARALLDEAGWQLGAAGLREKAGQPLKFVLLTNSGDKLREAVALFARQQWAELGVEVELQFLDLNTFIQEHVLKSDFDAILLSSSVNVDPDYLSRRYSSASLTTGHNFIRWSDPQLDGLLAQGLALTGQAERKQVYAEAQRIIAEASPSIPLYYRKIQWAFKSSVKGVVPSPTNIFWNAQQWGY